MRIADSPPQFHFRRLRAAAIHSGAYDEVQPFGTEVLFNLPGGFFTRICRDTLTQNACPLTNG